MRPTTRARTSRCRSTGSWDEISKCKNSSTQRVKAVKKILPHFDWTTGLTGTPASNGYKDLHGQYLVVDRGQRRTSKTAFRGRFYKKAGPYKEVPYEGAENEIKQLDRGHHAGDVSRGLQARPRGQRHQHRDARGSEAVYDRMEKEFFIQLDSGKQVEMFNQAALTNKCLQFANGAMYPVPGSSVGTDPRPRWRRWRRSSTMPCQQVLCAYGYRSDAERIMKRLAELRPINLTECKTEAALTNAMASGGHRETAPMTYHPKIQAVTGLTACRSAGTLWFGTG